MTASQPEHTVQLLLLASRALLLGVCRWLRQAEQPWQAEAAILCPEQVLQARAAHQRVLQEADDVGQDPVDGKAGWEGERDVADEQRHRELHRTAHRRALRVRAGRSEQLLLEPG